MTQADSVLSTPPTNTSAIDHPMMFPPVDPTRRRFLAVAAGASFVGAGSLAAAAMAPSVPQAVIVPIASSPALPDPVFGLIEAHRKADRDFDAALDEQNRLELIGDEAAADLVGEAPCHAAFNAFDVFLAAPAASFPVSSPSWTTSKTSRSAMRGCSMTAGAAQPA